MKRLACLIEVTPESGSLGVSALQFVESCANQAIDVFVFFYGDGVYTVHALRNAPTDEPPLQTLWTQVAERPNVTCVACVTAAERRGVTSNYVLSGCRLGGLGEWTEAMATADRVVQFR